MADASPDSLPHVTHEPVLLGIEPHDSPVVYDRRAPVAAHLVELDALHDEDKRVERKRHRVKIAAIVAGVLAFLSFFPTQGLGLIVFLPILAGLLIWRHFLWSGDLEDRRLHAARYVLDTLGPELKAGRLVRLRLDFGGYHKAKPAFDVSKGSGAPSFTKEWLELELPLLDGSAVSVTVSTKLKRKERRKRKYTKVKERLFDELDIALRAPRDVPLSALSVEELRQRFGGQHPLELTGCRVTARGAAFSFRTRSAMRTRLRNGWNGHNLEALLDGRDVLAAIIACHTAVVRDAKAPGAAA